MLVFLAGVTTVQAMQSNGIQQGLYKQEQCRFLRFDHPPGMSYCIEFCIWATSMNGCNTKPAVEVVFNRRASRLQFRPNNQVFGFCRWGIPLRFCDRIITKVLQLNLVCEFTAPSGQVWSGFQP